MKFTIKKTELLNALNKINGVTEKHNAIDILSNILLDVKENKLHIISTDTILEVSNVIECQSNIDGKITVPAYTFHDIIKRLSDDNSIVIELIDSQLIIKSGKSNFKIGVLSADGFPIMDDESFHTEFSLTKDELNALLNKVKYAVSGDEMRYYLNGVCWHSQENKLNAVATDGHRLAISNIESDIELDKVIIPIKSCAIVSKIMDSELNDVNILVSSNKIKFLFSDTIVITKLIDGQFPDYERIIPQENNISVSVNTKDLLDCINRVSSVLDSRSNGVTLDFKNDILSIKSTNNQDSASDELSCESGNLNLKIGINVKYLRDALSSLDSANATLLIDNDEKPIIVKSENNDNYQSIVSPLRV